MKKYLLSLLLLPALLFGQSFPLPLREPNKTQAQAGTLGSPYVMTPRRVADYVAAHGGGAPTDAKFITQIPNAGLSAEQALSTLATGILKNTTTTGVLSIAVAGDFPTLNQNTTGSAATLTTTRTIGGGSFNGSANVTAFPSPGPIGQTTPDVAAFTTLTTTGIAAIDGATASSSTALIVPAGTTAVSSLRIPHGAAPTSPVNGDAWTTTAGVFVRVNGATVQLGTGSGTVAVVGAGTLTSTALVTGGGTTLIQTPSANATLDSSGNISTSGTVSTGVGGGVAGGYGFGQGTANTPVANQIIIQAPTAVTAYRRDLAGTVGSTGFLLETVSGSIQTESLVTGSGSANVMRSTNPTLDAGSMTLAENASVALDPAGSADGKYTGITVTGTAGYTQAFGDLAYLDPTDSRWEAADANSAAGADGDARGLLGMVVSAGTDGTACTILLVGIIRADAKFPTFTVNNPVYVSETAGAVTQTQPTTTDVVIRIVGAALTADEFYFNPDFNWITHT